MVLLAGGLALGLAVPGRGQSPRWTRDDTAPAGAAGSGINWISIPGVVDGLTTYALYWKPEQPTGRAVIMLWGSWNLSVTDMLTNPGASALIQKFIDSGCAVLAVDQRGASGHGDFYQSLFDIGTDEVFDVISGALWLKAESAPRVLFLVGVSHGGSLALRSAEEFIHYGIAVDGIWAFGPITDYQAWMDWACAKQLWRCSFLLNWNAEQRFQGSPIHFVSKRLGPVFLVHGTQDSIVPVEQSRAWLKQDPDAILFEQPIDHVGLLNDASMQKGLEWMNRIALKKRR
jgi:dipeptidyl aminopeptidase/acylaminoacyl peptidase